MAFVPVIAIGHFSTQALAAISLGSMTGSVTGFGIIQGLASALDTLLPSAWTSPQPHLVGVWVQRMGLWISVTWTWGVIHSLPIRCCRGCCTVGKHICICADRKYQYLIGFQPIFVLWFNAERILLCLHQDPGVAHLAAVYLNWLSLGLPGCCGPF